MSDRLVDILPDIISLEGLATTLGEEWRPALLGAVIRGSLKMVSHECRGEYRPNNLLWDKTIVKAELVREWFAKQPVFSGRFKGAPPILTRNCILERLGEIWATSLDQAGLSKDRAAHPREDQFKTADVVAWWDRVNPESPPYAPATVLYDTPTELAGLLEESTPSTERTTDLVKKEAVKAGIAWRCGHPGESRRDLKTALADQLKIEIKDGWIDEIMRLTEGIPTNKGGRRKHP